MEVDAVQKAFEGGPWGVCALLVVALVFLVRHIISLYSRIDAMHVEWRSDSNQSLTSVSTALGTIQSTLNALNAQHKG